MRLTTACSARLSPPGCNRFLSEPDREASALAQGRIVLRPVRHPMPLLRDVVTASSVGFEGHDRHPRSGVRSPMPSRSGRQIAYSCNKATPIHNHFQLRRHCLSASEYRAARDRALDSWGDATGTALVG